MRRPVSIPILSPAPREIIAETVHSTELNPGVVTLDINGLLATNGQYLTPIGIGHPEMGEVNLARFDQPLVFAGIPWNLDRRLGVGGCPATGCEPITGPGSIPLGDLGLGPFPFSELDPRLNANAPLPLGAEERMFAYFPFGPTDFQTWPPPAALMPPSRSSQPKPSRSCVLK